MFSSRETAYAVDDDATFLDALVLTLECAGLEVKAFRSVDEFLGVYRPTGTSCLILDVHMPGVNGLQLQQLLAKKHEPIPIVFITGHADVTTSVTALKSGAIDFLQKPFSEDELLRSVREALTKDQSRRKLESDQQQVARRFSSLTAREREVMTMVVSDNSNKEIARALRISPRTVEHHREHVMHKMHASSFNELMIMAVICGVRELRL
jgi:two-component system response regulator FixJ